MSQAWFATCEKCGTTGSGELINGKPRVTIPAMKRRGKLIHRGRCGGLIRQHQTVSYDAVR